MDEKSDTLVIKRPAKKVQKSPHAVISGLILALVRLKCHFLPQGGGVISKMFWRASSRSSFTSTHPKSTGHTWGTQLVCRRTNSALVGEPRFHTKGWAEKTSSHWISVLPLDYSCLALKMNGFLTFGTTTVFCGCNLSWAKFHYGILMFAGIARHVNSGAHNQCNRPVEQKREGGFTDEVLGRLKCRNRRTVADLC